MTGDQAAGLVWAFGGLLLVGSALAARRLPVGRLGVMAMAWIAIFILAVTLAVAWQMVVHRPAALQEGAPALKPTNFT